ncbi:MAG: hypothetical protein NTV03_01895 [Candidatus Nomurabacteria bacterium]|nr:hypothetical protein [Candidatus Nomurabacteria bacterium]
MISYISFKKACKELRINPNIFGNNPLVGGHPLVTFEEPFDFGTMNFPEKQLKQILMIGQIIYNLESQVNLGHMYNLTTKKGREDYRRDSEIKKILPILQESIEFWLETGLKKCKSDKNLMFCNGRVFEVDPKQTEKMDEMNDYMKEVHRDFLYKEAMSEISARDVILNA